MNRRRFLQALFAVPCLGAPLLVPRVWEPPKYDWVRVGPGLTGPDTARTLNEALEKVRPGGTVFVMAGHHERVEPVQFRGSPGSWVVWPALLGEGG